jgi:hypothetical protein
MGLAMKPESTEKIAAESMGIGSFQIPGDRNPCGSLGSVGRMGLK